MVELCELKLMSNGVDCWPPDIDQHVAQLDFDDHLQSSSINEQSSLFASILLDPSVVSTDSMDMDTFRMRCENNKNDYKLTNFEDSGQWTTTSGIGASVTTGPNSTANNSPPTLLSAAKRDLILKRLQLFDHNGSNHNQHFGLALLEQLNNLDLEQEGESDGPMGEQRRKALIDNLVNHNCLGAMKSLGNPAAGTMTTWGRIQSTDMAPIFEEKTYSLPELHTPLHCNNANNRLLTTLGIGGTAGNNFSRPVSAALFLPAPPPPVTNNASSSTSSSSSSSSSSAGSKRPPSLLANFVEQQQQLFHQQQQAINQPVDYEYTENYVGQGRYVDLNENEIGFVPQSTEAIQKADRWRHDQPRSFAHATLTVPAAGSTRRNNSASPLRTFADLSPSQTAPDLKFLSMSHKTPSLCRSSISLDCMLKKKTPMPDQKILMQTANKNREAKKQRARGTVKNKKTGPNAK